MGSGRINKFNHLIKDTIGKRMDITTIESQKLNNAKVLRYELKQIFIDSIPRAELTSFQLGKLVGSQLVLDKIDELLEIEKE